MVRVGLYLAFGWLDGYAHVICTCFDAIERLACPPPGSCQARCAANLHKWQVTPKDKRQCGE